MNHPIPSTVRVDDLLRHLEDLRSGTYEDESYKFLQNFTYIHYSGRRLRCFSYKIGQRCTLPRLTIHCRYYSNINGGVS
jgi:hypothetical protein